MTDDMDARARVKRLEAENAQLREQAEEMVKRQAITQYWLDRANSAISAMSLEQALATPPPEGEPDDRVEAAYWDGRSDERKRWEPEQAHGDALAAFEKALWLILPEGANTQAHREALPLLQEVRQSLTASGVPEDRVPHKCPSCGSPSPERHPSVQFEGEVMTCHHPWHQRHPGDLGQQTAESVLRSLASWLGMGGYNADRVDPATFEAKIREGVEASIRVEKQRASGVPPVNDDDALSALDQTQYRRWASDPRGFVSSDVPVARLVQVVEAYRHRAASEKTPKHPCTYLDVMTALQERAYEFMSEDGEGGSVAVIHRMADEIDRLRTSGVPYVPEEVADLPEVWKQRYLDQASNTVAHALADELEAALASAPAVCEWKYTRTSLGRDGFKGACGADWWCEEGYGPAVISDVHPYCHGCGRRIQIAAAPSDGGSDD